MKLLERKRAAREVGPRLNQWKGARASQVSDQRQQARRERFLSRARRALRIGLWIVGLAMSAWGLTLVPQEMGPVLQSWLEIQEVEVEGIHHVTKPEVLERLVLKPGMGLHQVSTQYLAERVRAHAWIKEATVERRPPHLLHVAVLERTPAAIVQTGADYWLSDENGYLLAKLGKQDDPTLPLLIGLDPQSLQRGDVSVRNAIQSGVVLAKLIATTFDGRVEIDLTNSSNVLASADGVRFQFGSDSLVDQWERFLKVNPSFKTAPFDDRKRKVNEIDLRYDHRVIVRERV
ncbi:MAG TPA: FtsQ-type POTRA domain-containing protein [Nitrospiraceae bacterium]|nr:FtsQ-type POTRA domain-containing protein [Nitrospiraceae bacterium]